MLFLNKTDLFKEKISRIDMKDYCFPTYTGGLNFEAGSAFIKQRFLERNLSPHSIFGACALFVLLVLTPARPLYVRNRPRVRVRIQRCAQLRARRLSVK